VPPPGFRRVPEIGPGAFAFTSAEGPAAQTGNPMKRLIESFDLVTSLDIVDGDYLVFTVGKLDESRPWYPFKELDVAVEAYDRHTGRKLFENVPLPDGSRVSIGLRTFQVKRPVVGHFAPEMADNVAVTALLRWPQTKPSP